MTAASRVKESTEVTVGDSSASLPTTSTRQGRGETPSHIAHYEVRRIVGQGAVGRVYAAHDPRLDRPVAIKVLLGGGSRRTRERMRREAQALARLSHPNVVQVYEVGDDPRGLFLAMELVEGVTLDRWQRQERNIAELLDIYVQAGRGLAAAHATGLVHRDFKPHNVMVQADAPGRPRARVLDFGLARLAEIGAAPSTTTSSPAGDAPVNALTAAGGIVGTPAYMAPEQFVRSDVGPAADQFSLCVALWEALYEERPFRGASVAELMGELKHDLDAARPRNPKVPTRVHRALLRGLRVRPEDRFASMDELVSALQPRGSTTWRVVAAGIALSAAAWALWPASPSSEACATSSTLAGVWDDARRDGAAKAMLATDLAYAEQTWLLALERLDDYALDWQATRWASCVAATTATNATDALDVDRRTACLERARDALDAVADLLENADDATVRRALQLTQDLPGLPRCIDAGALSDPIPAPPAHERALVAEVRTLLARSRARRTAGRYADAHELTRRAEDLAGPLVYEPVGYEVAFERGLTLYNLGRHEPALVSLRAALALSSAGGDREVAFGAARSLARLLAVHLQRPDEARPFAEAAQRFAQTTEDQFRIELMWGQILRTEGDYQAAQARLERGIALLTDLDTEPLTLANARTILAGAHRIQGKYEQAMAELREALQIREAVFGVQHPIVAMTHGNLGNVLIGMGREDDAVAEYRTALDIYEATDSIGTADAALVMSNLAESLRYAGRYAEARTLHEQALAGRLRTLGADSPLIAHSRINLGRTLARLGELQEAESQCEAARLMFTTSRGDADAAAAHAHSCLAEVRSQRGEHGRAAESFREAIAVYTAVFGRDHLDTATTRLGLSDALWNAGRNDEAIHEARGALAAVEAQRSGGDELLAVARATAALRLVQTGAFDDARRILAPAAKHDDGPLPHDTRTRLRFARALLRWADATDDAARAEARAQVQAALDGALEETEQADVAAMRAWLDSAPSGQPSRAGID